jgi:hypothetical protein
MRRLVQPAALVASTPVVTTPAPVVPTRPATVWPEVRPHVVRSDEAPASASHAAVNGGSPEAEG